MSTKTYIRFIIFLILIFPPSEAHAERAQPEEVQEEQAAPEPVGERRWVEIGHGIRFGYGITTGDNQSATLPIAYVGTDVGYIYRSTDNGATWDEIRLLPDDRPLLNVPLMNARAIPFPNEGLIDDFIAPNPPGTWVGQETISYEYLGTLLNTRASGLTNYPYHQHPRLFYGPSTAGRGGEGLEGINETSINTYALVGSGARVETEDPGNLMASFFSGVSAQPGRVNWISICPSDPMTAFASTNFGAFRTRDMGITWDRVFIGSSAAENQVRCVFCHPEDPNIVMLNTAQGMRFSRDGGDLWDRPTSNLGNWGSNFVTLDSTDPNKILVGTGLGAYRTDFTGTEEENLYMADQPAPGVRIVTIVRGTSDPNIYYVATYDGASYTRDGGETWTRIAEFYLGHYRVHSLEVDPRDPMHIYLLIDRYVYESFDGGETLHQIHAGYTAFKYLWIDPSNPDILWLVGYSQIWRYERPRPVPTGPPSEIVRRARAALERDPGQYVVLDTALENAQLSPPIIQRIQDRMRRSSLVPTLNLFAWYHGYFNKLQITGDDLDRSHSPYYTIRCRHRYNQANLCNYLPGPPPMAVRSIDTSSEHMVGAFIVFSWAFGRAIRDERQTGRIWRDIFFMQNRIMYNVFDYWADRRRILEYLASGTSTPDEEIAYMLRLEEMSAVLDALTDNALGGPFGEQIQERF